MSNFIFFEVEMKRFFGFTDNVGKPAGFLSLDHLLLVFAFMTLAVTFAIILGRRYHGRPQREKNRVLIFTAIAIDSIELFKIILMCVRNHDPLNFLYDLPLFMCSIQLISIPMAAFCKGKLKSIALDLVVMFGLLGAVFGTLGAGNLFSSYPAWFFDCVVSVLTHWISGFSALYIGISGMATLEKRNSPLTIGVFSGFVFAAFVTNYLIDYNYMFLRAHDGTPYKILYNLVNGNPVLYPITVIALFYIYIAVFYYVAVKMKSKQTSTVCL